MRTQLYRSDLEMSTQLYRSDSEMSTQLYRSDLEMRTQLYKSDKEFTGLGIRSSLISSLAHSLKSNERL